MGEGVCTHIRVWVCTCVHVLTISVHETCAPLPTLFAKSRNLTQVASWQCKNYQQFYTSWLITYLEKLQQSTVQSPSVMFLAINIAGHVHVSGQELTINRSISFTNCNFALSHTLYNHAESDLSIIWTPLCLISPLPHDFICTAREVLSLTIKCH